MRQFYGHPEKMRSFCRKNHVHKIPRFRGGVFWVLGGGGSADFIFMGARIFLNLCKVCRSAAVKFSPETVPGSCHGKCREISGEILLLLFPQETKLESAQNFSRRISRHFSRDVLQLQVPNFMAFFTLQTFVPEKSGKYPLGCFSQKSFKNPCP